jgi:micrococcal nuclease
MRLVLILSVLAMTACRTSKTVPSRTASALYDKCVSVQNGDTITLLSADKVQHKIKLYGIDAPELKQDFADASKRHLSNIVLGKPVRYEDHGKDRYGRVLAVVFCGRLKFK